MCHWYQIPKYGLHFPRKVKMFSVLSSIKTYTYQSQRYKLFKSSPCIKILTHYFKKIEKYSGYFFPIHEGRLKNMKHYTELSFSLQVSHNWQIFQYLATSERYLEN
jgi:hypothetical protein